MYLSALVRHLSLQSLLQYIEDCHGLTAYDLEQREINPKSHLDVADAIDFYGWAEACFAYCS